jgi:hypothetical protein
MNTKLCGVERWRGKLSAICIGRGASKRVEEDSQTDLEGV